MTYQQILQLANQHADARGYITQEGVIAFAKDLLAKEGTREHWRRTFAAAALPAYLGKGGNLTVQAVDYALSAAEEMTRRFFPTEQ